MAKKLSYISLFSGIGGLDYGLERAGFSNIACIEIDKDACNLLAANTKWNVINSDIREIDFRKIIRKSGIKKGELELLVGGPPCQSYSKSSFWTSSVKRGYADSRGKLIDHYMRAVEETLPKAFLIENVPGFISSENNGLSVVKRWLKKINISSGVEYSFNYKILNCADYGVPQKRERVFLIANRIDADFEFPLPTHGDPKSVDVIRGKIKPYKTPAQAFWGIDYSELKEDLKAGGKWKELLPCVPPGQNYQFFTDKGTGPKLFDYRSRYWTFLLKLSPFQPSWTLQASPGSSTGPFHWENRKLHSRELARLQTIPDEIKLSKIPRINQRLIGNAIPSLMGEILGKEIQKQIFGHQIRMAFKLLPGNSSLRIKPRYQYRVPSQFLRQLS